MYHNSIRVLFLVPGQKWAKTRSEFILEELRKKDNLVLQVIQVFDLNRPLRTLIIGLFKTLNAMNFRPHIIIAHTQICGLIGNILSYLFKLPLVTEISDYLYDQPLSFPKKTLFYLCDIINTKQSYHLVTCGVNDITYLKNVFDVNPSKVTIIGHGISNEFVSFKIKKHLQSKGKDHSPTLTIGYVGNLNDNDRDIEIIYKAIEYIGTHINEQIRHTMKRIDFIFVGEGKWKKRLLELSKRLNNDKIQLTVCGGTSNIKDIVNWYSKFDASLAPYRKRYLRFNSTTFTFLGLYPMKIIESLSMDVPLILPNYKEYQDEFSNVGLFYNASNYKSLARLIIKLANNDISIAKLKRQVQQSKSSKKNLTVKTWKDIAQEYYKLILKVYTIYYNKRIKKV